MRSIYIAIPDDAADKLGELARREFRAPRQQAAILVLAGLKRARLDTNHRPEDPVEPPVSTLDRSRRASGKVARIDALDGAG